MFNFQVKNDVQARLNQSANTSSEPRPAEYTVKRGDTVSGLAKKFNTTPEDIRKRAKISGNNLQIGQGIDLPSHKVVKGDSISKICTKYGMNRAQFNALNPSMKGKDTIIVDEILFVPVKPFETVSTNTVAPVPSSPMITSTDIGYEVKKGDSVKKIAKRFNTTEKYIMELADIKHSLSLKAGQKLALPSIEVKRSMTVDGICQEYNMSMDQFEDLNPDIKDPNILDVGQIVYVPVKPFEKAEASSSTGGTKSTEVKLNNGKTRTVQELRDGAINSAVTAHKNNGCNSPYVSRPYPNIVNGKIEATCEVLAPTNKGSNAPLKGNVIIVNPGHGGYAQGNGFFDPGTIDTRKDASGKTVPLEEWSVNELYADDLSSKLRAKGATVVIVQGAVGNGGMDAQDYLEGLLKGNKGPQEARDLMKNTKKQDMLFVSVHIESAKESPNDMKCGVFYGRTYDKKKKEYIIDAKDKVLAEAIKQELEKNFKQYTPKVSTKGLYVLRAMGTDVPAVLIEVGNIANETIKRSLLSEDDRGKYMTCVTDAIVKTLNPEAAEDDTQ